LGTAVRDGTGATDVDAGPSGAASEVIPMKRPGRNPRGKICTASGRTCKKEVKWVNRKGLEYACDQHAVGPDFVPYDDRAN
jgi:hypothetical protein